MKCGKDWKTAHFVFNLQLFLGIFEPKLDLVPMLFLGQQLFCNSCLFFVQTQKLFWYFLKIDSRIFKEKQIIRLQVVDLQWFKVTTDLDFLWGQIDDPDKLLNL